MPTPGEVFQATPVSYGGGRVIASPFQFALTEDDNLQIVSANSVTGVALTIQGRRLSTAGKIEPFSFQHIPNTDRSTRSENFTLGAGSLLNLVIFVSSGAPRIGQTYVSARLIRGLSAATILLGGVLGGYVTAAQVLGYPGSPIKTSFEDGGVIRTLNGTDPAAGSEIHEVVPTGARWQLIALGATLACSGVGGVRRPTLVLAPGGAQVGFCPSNYDAPAGLSTIYPWAVGMTFSARVGSVQQSAGLPTEPLLVAGSSIDTQTLGFDAGDNWNAPTMVVREWLEVN
jgi:hypothetical protein